MPRTNRYVLEIGGRWYYYDTNFTLRGPHETEEKATKALKELYEMYSKKLD